MIALMTTGDKFTRAIDDNPRFVAVPPTGRGVRSSERGRNARTLAEPRLR
jgi:hypothetical protein